MRRLAPLAGVFLLAACATGKAAPPPATGTPAPSASIAPLKLEVLTDRLGPPVKRSTGTCPSPGRKVNQLRPAPLSRSSWELAWAEAEEGELNQATVTPDGALWALHDTDDTQEPVRWTGSAWKKLPDLPLGKGPVWVRLGAASADKAWVIVQNAPPMSPYDPPATYSVSTWDGQAWRSEWVDLGVQSASGETLAAQGAWLLLGDRAMRWSGTAWQTAPLPSYGDKVAGTTKEPWVIATPDPDENVVADPDENVVAQVHLSRWTDRGWQAVPLPAGMTLPPGTEPSHSDKPMTEIGGVARTGPEEFWVAGAFNWGEHEPVDGEEIVVSRKLVMRNVAGRWSCWWGRTDDSDEPDSFVDAVPDGRGGLWAATELGMLWHLSDGRWTREQAPVDKGVPVIRDLACSPGGEIYALGGIDSEAWAEDIRPALWRLKP